MRTCEYTSTLIVVRTNGQSIGVGLVARVRRRSAIWREASLVIDVTVRQIDKRDASIDATRCSSSPPRPAYRRRLDASRRLAVGGRSPRRYKYLTAEQQT